MISALDMCPDSPFLDRAPITSYAQRDLVKTTDARKGIRENPSKNVLSVDKICVQWTWLKECCDV